MLKGEKTRQFIIERTAPLFNRKGYAGTSMSDIMAVTGLTKGGIYGNFESKEEVMIAAFQHNLKALRTHFLDVMDNKSTYKEKLIAYPELYKECFQQLMRNGGCPIQNTAIEADDTHPVLRSMANEALTIWRNEISGFVERGIAVGEFITKALSPQQIAVTIIAAIEGAIMVSGVSGQAADLTLVMDAVTSMIEGLS
ncbi:MAG: TetR/AcrR family transcriptional regulator [Chitinophagaceae bacterium]|nr:MAG: TetR/AcrR family transcriptional regulator [Chitinophagaceae bacterium]